MTHKSRSGFHSWVFTVRICPYVLICIFKYCRQKRMQLFAIPLMNFQCEEASLKSTLKKGEKKLFAFVLSILSKMSEFSVRLDSHF